MWKVTLRDLMSNKRRVVSTALSVIIGIAFLAGSFVFTDTIKRTFDNLFADVNNDTDAYVRSATEIEGDFGVSARARIPDSLVATVAAVPGVAAASGEVNGFAMIIDKDGKPIGNPNNGPPTLGGDITEGPLSAWDLTDGSSYPHGDQALIDNGSFKKGHFAIGDTVTIASQAGTRQFELVGSVTFGGADSPAGATFALFDTATAQAFMGKPGELDGIRAKADSGVSQTELTQSIRQVVGSDVEVLTGSALTKENQNDIEQGLKFFNIMLTVFAAIALFVSSFIIYNTFSILVAQRQRDTALLRALGAGRGQVMRSVVAESFVVGLVASILGLGGGIAIAGLLKAGLDALGVDIPAGGTVLLTRTVVASILVGVIITVVSAVGPAVRASRVPPVAAMREVAIDESGTSRKRFLSGAVITGLGAVGIALGLTGTGIQWLGLGVALVFIGVFVLGPLISRPVARVIGAPVARFRGVTGSLARENAMRSPKRTARTAAALMVGVALVTGISVLASSVKASIRNLFGEQIAGDYIVEARSQGFGGLSTTLADQLNDLPEVKAAAGVQQGLARVDDKSEFVSVVVPSVLGKLFDFDFTAGSTDSLTDDGILVSKDRADKDDLALGSTVDMTFTDNVVHHLKVEGIYKKDELAGPYTISRALYASSGVDQYDFAVFIDAADGVSATDARAAIASVVDQFPNGKLQSRAEYIDEQAQSINSFVNLIYGLLALAVIIAALGISNTLRLSTFERTRELGLLRAVGTTRRQIRSMVTWESVITALLGTVQGIVIGIALGYAVILALRDQGLNTFSVPVGGIITVIVMALLLGVLAAFLPARKASKLDILDAIATA